MSSRVKQRLSFANVMSCVAVFIALGGSAYAVIDLRKNQVRSTHIKNGQVKTADLRNNAVISKKVRDGSLLAADFAVGQLPAGAPGAKGDTGPRGPIGETGSAGPQGPAGATDVTERVGTEVVVNGGTAGTATASCLAGERAVGGGWGYVGGQVDPIVYESRATGTPPSGWTLRIWKAPGGSVTLAATVMCAAP